MTCPLDHLPVDHNWNSPALGNDANYYIGVIGENHVDTGARGRESKSGSVNVLTDYLKSYFPFSCQEHNSAVQSPSAAPNSGMRQKRCKKQDMRSSQSVVFRIRSCQKWLLKGAVVLRIRPARAWLESFLSLQRSVLWRDCILMPCEFYIYKNKSALQYEHTTHLKIRWL